MRIGNDFRRTGHLCLCSCIFSWMSFFFCISMSVLASLFKLNIIIQKVKSKWNVVKTIPTTLICRRDFRHLWHSISCVKIKFEKKLWFTTTFSLLKVSLLSTASNQSIWLLCFVNLLFPRKHLLLFKFLPPWLFHSLFPSRIPTCLLSVTSALLYFCLRIQQTAQKSKFD